MPPIRGLILTVALLFGVVPTSSRAQGSPASLADRVTIAFGDSAGGCVSVEDSVAQSHPPITILWPPANQAGGAVGRVLRARVGARREHCPPIDEPGYGIDGAQIDSRAPYLVIIGKTGPARAYKDRIEIDVTGDGKPESVRVCTSMEGVHYTIWAGRPFRSVLLAHQYAPLGYDVEPSCTSAETTEPRPA
jgi:hypothetical protein